MTAVTWQPAAAPVVSATRLRDAGLDAFRGLAILLMIGDHLSLFLGLDGYRMTLGRLAMPAFFLLAGQLAGRLRWRHAWVAGLGVLLPLAAPWVDSPNVLIWWAVGSVVLAGCGWLGGRVRWLDGYQLVQLVAVLGLLVAANGWELGGHTYQPAALVGLMALGACWPRSWFTWAGAAPSWVAAVGRHPLAWYVGHVLVLEGVFLWLSNV